RVVTALDLPSRAGFRVEGDDLSPLKKWMIEKGLSSDPTKLTPERQAIEIYLDDLQVYPVVGTTVISVTYTSTDPTTAAEVANSVADEYVNLTREAQSMTTSKATEWLAEQIEQLREKVVASESAVEAYRTEAGLLQGSQSMLSNES